MSEEKGRPLPKFGDWDVNDPASAEGFTVIFNKARDEKKTGGKPDSPSNVDPGNKHAAAPVKKPPAVSGPLIFLVIAGFCFLIIIMIRHYDCMPRVLCPDRWSCIIMPFISFSRLNFLCCHYSLLVYSSTFLYCGLSIKRDFLNVDLNFVFDLTVKGLLQI